MEWIELFGINVIPQSTPLHSLIALSDSSFCIVSGISGAYGSDGYSTVIHKYDPIIDEWNEWIKYPPHLQINPNIISCLESTTNTLYIYNKDKGTLIKLNIETHKIDIHYNLIRIEDPQLISVEHELHVFGSLNNGVTVFGSTVHWVFDETQQKFKETHVFRQRITGFGLSYLSKNNEILLVGGYNWSIWRYPECVRSYSTTKRIWTESVPEAAQKRMCVGWILTKDERFAITFGGWVDPGRNVDDIYILDIQQMVWTQSNIKCPIKSSNLTVSIINDRTQTDLLIFGYIRELFLDIHYPPDDVIKLIQTWVADEWLHLINDSCGETNVKKRHWKIRLSDILSFGSV